MEANFFAERAARNIHQLTESEEEALRKSPEFRERVIDAFKRVNGPESELKIKIKRGILLLSWFQTIDRVISLSSKVYDSAKSLAIKIYKNAVEETEKKGLNPGEFNNAELTEFISNIIKKVNSLIRFVIKTHDEKYFLFGSSVDSSGGNNPIILICNRNSKNNTFDIGILVSIYSVENNLENMPNATLVSDYRYNPESNSFEREYIRMGFNHMSDSINLVHWYKQ